MYFSTSFISTALLGLAAATTHMGELAASETLSSASSTIAAAAAAAPTGSAVAAAAGMVTVHVVQVGGSNASLIFSPNNVVAAPGDLVQFQFNAKNHSVVQSTFDQPCVPIQNVMPNKTDAFFSGFKANNHTFGSAVGGQLEYTVRVMDTKPIWFYCSQAKHCQSGMVGAINAATTGNKTVEAFASLAAQAVENITPNQAAGAGQASPSSGGTPGVAASSAAGGAAATGTESSATASSANDPAQATTNAAPGRSATDSLLGLGVAGLAAFLAL